MGLVIDVFKPDKTRIIVLIVVYLMFLITTQQCNLMLRICPVESQSQDALEYDITTYPMMPEGVGARPVPLSCAQACSDEEYNYFLRLAILYKIIIPLMIIYTLSSIIIFLFEKRK